jgi:glycosyl transferase family 25
MNKSDNSIDITQIKSHVINLKSNTEKLKRVQKSLNAISIFPERFDAVYGKDLDPLYIDKITYPFVQYTMKNGRYIDSNIETLGAIGCYLSHVKLWEMLANSDDDMLLILEDDAVTNNFSAFQINQFLNEIIENDPNWDVIFLGYSKPFPSPNVDTFISNSVYKINEITFQTHAYVLSKKGALKLLSKAFPIVDQVDSYMSYMAITRGLNSYRGNANYIKQFNEEGSSIQAGVSLKIFLNRCSPRSLWLCIIFIIVFLILLAIILVNKKL